MHRLSTTKEPNMMLLIHIRSKRIGYEGLEQGGRGDHQSRDEEAPYELPRSSGETGANRN